MNYTNNRNNRRCVSRPSTKANINQSKVLFNHEIKRDKITATAAAAIANGHCSKNIVTTTSRDKSCIQTILDSLDGYYNDKRVQVVKEPSSPVKPPIRNLSFSSLNTQLPKEIIKKESSSPPPTVPSASAPKHSNNKMKKGLPRRRHSLPDNAKLPNNVKLNASRIQGPAVSPTPRPQSSTQPIKQPRRRRHTLSDTERPDISCIQSFIRQSNIHEEDYYHHQQSNKLAVVKTHEFERVDTNQIHEYERIKKDHNQSFTNNNNNNKQKSQVKRIITERRRRHSMPDNMRAPNPSDLLMSLPLTSTNGKGLNLSLDKHRDTVKRVDHTPAPDKYKNEDKEKYRYKVGQTLQDATSHSLRFTSNLQATKLLSQLPINTPLFVKRTSNQQWQAQWSYCILVKHIYNESKFIGVEVSLTDIEEGKDKKGRVRTKVIEERYFERWLMMVNAKTVLVQGQGSTTPTTTLPASTSPADYDAEDQTDMATRGSESNQVNDRPPRMIFQGNKEDVTSSIYPSSSSSSGSSSDWGASSTSKEFYSVISSTESFTSSSLYSSCSSDTSSSYGHDIVGRYLDFNSPIPLPNDDDDDVSTTSARSSSCSSGDSDRVLIASKSARLLRASL